MDRERVKNLILKLDRDVQDAKVLAEAWEKKLEKERETCEKMEAQAREVKKDRCDHKLQQLKEAENERQVLEVKVSATHTALQKMVAEIEASQKKLDELEDNLGSLEDTQQQLAAKQKTQDEKLSEQQRVNHRLEEELAEANKVAAKADKKLQDKQEDIASLEKILKLKSIRLAVLTNEGREKDAEIEEHEQMVAAEVEACHNLEEEIQHLIAQVAEARDEQINIEQHHSAFIRARDDLRSDAMNSKYF